MTVKKAVVQILIADDHTIFRDGLKAMFSAEPGFHVAGEACDGDETVKMVEKLRPDVLLLDLLMPRVSGLKVLELLVDRRAKVRTILLSGAADGNEISRAFELGARGLVLKESASSLLLDSVRAVMAGQYWVGRKSVANLAQTLDFFKNSSKRKALKSFGLTAREMEIVRAVVSGYSNKEIAAKYGISEQTVKHHITNIFDKLGVYNRLELTLFVFHHNLIEE
jgi:DNA-binding NarL/FixJ family response regulator